MPIVTEILNKAFYSQGANGELFTDLAAGSTKNLVANMGNRIRFECDLIVQWHATSSVQDAFYLSDGDTITRTTGSFLDPQNNDGLCEGDDLILYVDYVSGYETATVVSITDKVLKITSISGGVIANGLYPNGPATNYTDDTKLHIAGESNLESLLFKMGLPENSETFNFNSKVTGKEMAFYCAGIDHISTAAINLQPINQNINLDWYTCPVSKGFRQDITWIEDIRGYYSQKIQKFHLCIDFQMPFYLEQWEGNLLNGTIPPALLGLKSWKFVMETEFRTVLSRPSTAKKFRWESEQGCTGFYNESLNGFNNVYEITSISYTDALTNPLSGLSLTQQTTVIVIVTKNNPLGDPNFHANEYIVVDIFNRAKQFQYRDKTTNKTNNQEQNFKFDNAVAQIGGASSIGINGIITGITCSLNGATELAITFNVDYSSIGYDTDLDKDFMVCVEVGNTVTLGAENTDKVKIGILGNGFVIAADILDLFLFEEFDYFKHNQSFTI